MEKFANRHWDQELGKEGYPFYKLLFAEYYDEKDILRFTQDKEDPTCFWYYSELLNVEQDCISCETVNEAKEEFEEMITDYIEEEIGRLENWLEKFNEVVEDERHKA